MSRIANMPAAASGVAMNIADAFRHQAGEDGCLAWLELEKRLAGRTLGLLAVLEEQIREFVDVTGLQCDSLIDLSPDCPVPEGALAAAAFRIFHEMLHNVARHACATAVRIRIRFMPGLLQLDVTDNGMGAPQESFEQVQSSGVRAMRDRSRQFGGSLHIVSVPGGGTHVCLRLPLP